MVSSNDPARPQVGLQLSADLEIVLELEPRYLNFGVVTRRQATDRAIKLIGPDAAQTKLLSVTYRSLKPAPGGATRPDPLVVKQEGEGVEPGGFTVSVAPDAPSGQFDGFLVVKTDHPKLPELNTRVRGTLTGVVTYRPQRLIFRVEENVDEAPQTVTISGSKNHPVEVVEVTSEHPAVTATLGERVAGRTPITVTCNGELQRATEIATLVIRTTSTEDPVIEIPVHMMKMKAGVGRTLRPPAKQTPPTDR